MGLSLFVVRVGDKRRFYKTLICACRLRGLIHCRSLQTDFERKPPQRPRCQMREEEIVRLGKQQGLFSKLSYEHIPFAAIARLFLV